MYILGISGGVRQGNMDGSATLMEDGKVIASIEEERLLRIKHATGRLPEQAIRLVLQKAGISIREVDYLVFPGETYVNFHQILRDYFKAKFGHCPKIELVNHHNAHAASTYYASGFEEAMVLTMDLSGDGISTQLAIGKSNTLSAIQRFLKPNSLGIFYSILTQFCGFNRDNDEYKVMGLSSYGERGSHDFKWLVDYAAGAYHLDTQYIKVAKKGMPNPSKQEPMYHAALVEKLGAPRLPESPMTKYYENIAASGQEHLENVIIHLIETFHKKTGLRKICLAGGVALNCVANQRIMNLDCIDAIFVQPASNDAGLSLGSAYLIASGLGYSIEPMKNVYLGTEFSNDEILEALKKTNLKYKKIEDVSAYAAQRVADNRIVGWFQGRMEFGPRALGARSILGNSQNAAMKDIINHKIKFRESFRPFCPSVLEEAATDYFVGKSRVAPFMTITYDVKEAAKSRLPSITHVDGTARIQTVNEQQHPLYYQYLKSLKKLNGTGVSINTSFNVKGQCIVNTPYHAFSTFYGSGMDDLVIGNFVLAK
ncbi:MAG: carbamoyltransferase C-terminal domain-containing protein [Bacteroidota bacterium]